MLRADRQTDGVLKDALLRQLLRAELGMGGGSGVDDKALDVRDVCEQRDDLEIVDESPRLFPAAFDLKGEDRRAAVGEILLIQRVIGLIGPGGMGDRLDLRMLSEELQ